MNYEAFALNSASCLPGTFSSVTMEWQDSSLSFAHLLYLAVESSCKEECYFNKAWSRHDWKRSHKNAENRPT